MGKRSAPKLSSNQSTLLNFLQSKSNREVLTLGVGSAGCRIVSRLQASRNLIGRFAYTSTEEKDLNYSDKGDKLLIENGFRGKTSPFYVRGKAGRETSKIKELLEESKLVFLVAGLGGSVGSGIAPLVAQIARESELLTVCVAVMPYSFEKDRHFYAGTTLRKLRSLADGVIVVDNDELLREAPERPVLEAYNLVNGRVALALSAIAGGSDGKNLDTGLNTLLDAVMQKGYAVLNVFESSSINACEESVIEAIQSTYRMTGPDAASKVVLHLVGDGKTSVGDMAASVNRVHSLLGDESLTVHTGVSVGTGGGLTAVLLASGFETTKYDDYDPLDQVLNTQMDDSLDSHVSLELESLTSIE